MSPSPYLQDSDFQLFCGDSREVLSTLPAESVHMAVTSPPFFGLRDYGTGTWEGGEDGCDHAAGRKNTSHAGNVGPFHGEHSDWFKPYVAGFYAFKYLHEEIDRAEAEARLDELLGLELSGSQLVLSATQEKAQSA